MTLHARVGFPELIQQFSDYFEGNKEKQKRCFTPRSSVLGLKSLEKKG